MSDFEYFFSFYGLLLGLAVANVATGFADIWRDRQSAAIGMCVPMLASIVLFGGMNVWLVNWGAREVVTLDAWRMLSAAGVALPYVFISRAMFPTADQKTALDDHYMQHRKFILVALAVSPSVSATTTLILNNGSFGLWSGAWIATRILSPLLLIPFGHLKVQKAGLALIIVLLVVGLFR
ncbi:hypothetical protein [Sphingomonas turrisvirgatae]|uniref:Uncharacterized protein n=1 Tax=Sphingomonas turrisvirgatae TaxID=1888892 RepID=A0A1E3LVX4_9SPHN|nr:hypothetical protein [Sphingomonas turrisvirgatae]ODP37903.1 hypothetical protein BFL28_16585 [Sphingomonas turrisvirgatae]